MSEADKRPVRLLTSKDQLIGLMLAGLTLVALLASMDLGYTRDEGYYFRAAYEYLGWFKTFDWGTSFSQPVIDKYFTYNAEHPPLPKVLFALSYWIFHEGLGWMDAGTAMRLPGALSAAVLSYLVYLFGAEAFGRKEGALAAALTLLMPRPFFHAHLACFDTMVVTTWFAVMYAYWKAMRGSTKWMWGAGVALGLAISVKHNAFFAGPMLVLHWLLVNWRSFGLGKEEGKTVLKVPKVPKVFVSMAVGAPIVWHLLWPYHWFDTFARVQWYFQFHLKHVHYFQYYFGQNLYAPPFPIEFPFAMSAFTMPEVTLIAFVLGAVALVTAWWRRRKTGDKDGLGTGTWLILGGLVPFLIIAHPNTPVFGGIKHWMPAMPFIALVAAVGVFAALRAFASSVNWSAGRMRLVTWATVVLVLLPSVTALVHNHGYGTAFYNTWIGSARGAAESKMMRQFWGYSSVHSIPFMNLEVGDKRPVFFQNTNHDSYAMYKRTGQLRDDIRYGQMANSDYAMIHHQMAARNLELDIWKVYGGRNPAFVGSYEGVPVISLYPNKKRLRRLRGKKRKLPKKGEVKK